MDELDVGPGNLRPVHWGRLDEDPRSSAESIREPVAVDVELASGERLRLAEPADAVAFVVAGTIEYRRDTQSQTLCEGASIFIPGGTCDVVNVGGEVVARLLVVRGADPAPNPTER